MRDGFLIFFVLLISFTNFIKYLLNAQNGQLKMGYFTNFIIDNEDIFQ